VVDSITMLGDIIRFSNGSNQWCCNIFLGELQMKPLVDWKSVEQKISRVIQKMYKPGTTFISTQFISEEMHKNGVFQNLSYRTAVIRVGTVLKDHWKFPIYANKSHGAIFMVPKEWWKRRGRHERLST
jgi:hypothetical protein